MRAAPDPTRLHRLIVEEWPSVPADAVARAGADLDLLAGVVVDHTDHTRALLRLQLAELVLVAERLADMESSAGPGHAHREASTPRPDRRSGAGPSRPQPSPEGARKAPPFDDPDILLGQVEAYLWELARAVPNDLATASARGARKHMGVSLSIAAAIGFLLGMFIGGGTRRDDAA